jgi:class 3 adenylate cyclase
VTQQLPSGTVTFLFTDIEGSTALWARNPDEMKAALAEHDGILRGAFETSGGYVFATGGDGFAVAFHTPEEALSAAIETQRELRNGTWPHGLDVRVRMGIHTGVSEERDGNYFGPTVNLAARVMGAGHGGQVLASQVSAGLLGRDDAIELGEYRLSGIPDAVAIVQFSASSESSTFPPLRANQRARGNLVQPASRFVGRDRELDDLSRRLRDQRLVTLIGVGGTGKTRLAVEVGSATADEYPDGVWVAELGGR